MPKEMKIFLPKPGETFQSFYSPIAARSTILICDSAVL